MTNIYKNNTFENLRGGVMSYNLKILSCCILSVIMVAIVIGNVIIICAIRLKNPASKSGANLRITLSLVVSLAVTDILVGVVCMPFKLYVFMSESLGNGDIGCLLGTSTDIATCTSSIFHLLMMSVDRYLAICRPLFHRSLPHYVVHIAIAICWIIPILMVFPFSFATLFSDRLTTDSRECSPFEDNAFSTISSTISFIIPATCISIFYCRIYNTIRNRNGNTIGDSMDPRTHHRHDAAAAKTIAIILACFFICWSPFFCLLILHTFVTNDSFHLANILTEWLGYANSMMNPLLYFRCNKSINSSVKELLKCSFQRDNPSVELHVI